MSLWINRKDKDGKTHMYAIPFAPTLIIAVIGVLVALLLPAIQALKMWLRS
jgi:hypothetical protein